MYSEMADLLSKLDGQIHELNQYYSQRPDLHSVGACVQVSCTLWGLVSRLVALCGGLCPG